MTARKTVDEKDIGRAGGEKRLKSEHKSIELDTSITFKIILFFIIHGCSPFTSLGLCPARVLLL